MEWQRDGPADGRTVGGTDRDGQGTEKRRDRGTEGPRDGTIFLDGWRDGVTLTQRGTDERTYGRRGWRTYARTL